MQSNRPRMTLEPTGTQVTTQVQVIKKIMHGTVQTLQTTLRFLQKQLLSRQTVLLDPGDNGHDAPGSDSAPVGSTAFALRSLTRPSPRLARLSRRHAQEFAEDYQDQPSTFHATLIGDNGKEQELQVLPHPRPRRRMHPESVLEQLRHFGLDESEPSLRLSRRQNFSAAIFVQVSVVAYMAVSENSQERFVSQLTRMALGLAISHALSLYAQQLAEMNSAFVESFESGMSALRPAGLHNLRSLDFGNPLQIQIPGRSARLRLPNPQQIFAANYYRPSVPRPLALPGNHQRLVAAGFDLDQVPDRFKCEMVGTVMDNPVTLPGTGQMCDGAAVLHHLQKKPYNPYNRQPMTMDDAKPDLALRAEISSFVNDVVKRAKDKPELSTSRPKSPTPYRS